MKAFALFLALFAVSPNSAAADDPLVVIGHDSLTHTDASTLRRIYTGRAVSIERQPAIPVNLPPGHPWRKQFLDLVLGQNEDQYVGYWLVRRYVGKGAPPVEVTDVNELLNYIRSTPGALGYLPASKVPATSKVIFSASIESLETHPDPNRILHLRFADIALVPPDLPH